MKRSKPRATAESLRNDPLGVAQDVLNRMSENHERGMGIHLSALELEALSISKVGSLWAQEDPRTSEDVEED